MEAVQRLIQRLLDRAATIGADPHDDDERRLRKALLVLLSVLILPISLVWGTLFLALGAIYFLCTQVLGLRLDVDPNEVMRRAQAYARGAAN